MKLRIFLAALALRDVCSLATTKPAPTNTSAFSGGDVWAQGHSDLQNAG